MNINSLNRRWPQPNERWLTTAHNHRDVLTKTNTKLILHGDVERTHSGVCSTGSEYNLITYLK